ncbi:MAG: Jag N-terminal domain-containing protein [Actinomycetota bacterium]|nr:Jag N-terminal domain-containing protein [Actinomycetota bacterium]
MGRTLEEAKDAALEQLGVDVSDAEFVVVAEPKAGLFGRLRGEARVRARVRPAQPRPKRGRDRHRASGDSRRRATGPRREGTPSARTEIATAAGKAPRSKRSSSRWDPLLDGGDEAAAGSAAAPASDGAGPADGRSGEGRRRRGGRGRGSGGAPPTAGEEPGDLQVDPSEADGAELLAADATVVAVTAKRGDVTTADLARMGRGSAFGAADGEEISDSTGRRARGDDDQRSSSGRRDERSTQDAEKEEPVGDMTVQDQGDAARVFVRDLVERLGLQASVDVLPVDEATVTVAVQGDELGILVGPGGSTLAALQELTRTYVQKITGGQSDRIMVDVAGYRAKRVAALERFTRGVAEEVLASGQPRALEAMSAADRKVVHDTVNEIDGVATRSEGEDDRRYVIILPSEPRGDG